MSQVGCDIDGLVESETGISVSGENLGNRVDIGGSSEVEAKVHLDGSAHDALGGSLHGVVQAGVDNVLLAGSRHSCIELLTGCDLNWTSNAAEPLLKGVLHTLQQVVVGFPLILEGQTTVGDVVQVLQPLKVGDGDTAGVDVHVRDNQATVLLSQWRYDTE